MYHPAVNNLKQTLMEQWSLTTFQVDASMMLLGAALIQDGRPVAFASKALTMLKEGMPTLTESYSLSYMAAKNFTPTCMAEASLST